MRGPALFLLLATACSSSSSTTKSVRVAAASDLAHAFDEVGKAFQAKTGIEPIITYGSSGLLAKQIEQGAPFYLFASASKEYAQIGIDAKKCDASSSTPYARGRLVVWTASGVTAPKRLADLVDPAWRRIAIANPEHAPYGRAAQQALEKVGAWAVVKDRMVLGENVQAAMQYAVTRNADAAIVALSLAVVNKGGGFLPIDPTAHAPLDQELVVCGTGEEAASARALAAFIASPDGREIMTRYGFLLPNETLRPGK